MNWEGKQFGLYFPLSTSSTKQHVPNHLWSELSEVCIWSCTPRFWKSYPRTILFSVPA